MRATLAGCLMPHPVCSTLHPISDAWAALQITRFWACYTGPAFTVKRSSDNAVTDIYFLADGALDVATLLAFTGGAGATVIKWFDSSGHGHHFTYTTGSPSIVNSGVYLNGVDHGSGASAQSDDISGSPESMNVFLDCYLGTPGGGGSEYFWLLGASQAGAEDGGYVSFNASNPSYDSAVVNDPAHYKLESKQEFGQLEANHKIAVRWDRNPPGGFGPSGENLNYILVDGVELVGTLSGVYGSAPTTFTPRTWYFGGPGAASDIPMKVRSFLIYEARKSDAEMLTIQQAQ